MSASYLRKYGTGTGADIYINVPKAGSANHAVGADWTPSAGDVKISKDGGAAANIGTLPVAVAMGNSSIWKFVFTDAELQAAFIAVTVSDSATKAVDDTGFSIETYGNASAQHAFDLDTANPTVGGYASGQAPLQPTVAGRTLDVTATGAAGVDWANVEGQATTVNLDGTRINAVDNLAVGTDSINTVATVGSTLTTGSTVAGTYASTAQLDSSYWQIADTAGTLDMYFEFNVGTNGIPTTADWVGALTAATNTLKVYAWNWGSSAWEQIGTVVGIATLTIQEHTFDFTNAHVGTGANDGLVRLRFQNTGLTAANFYTDRVICGYSETYSFPANFSATAIDASGHVILQDASLVTAKLGTFALAKTTNITGFNDLSAAGVNAEVVDALATDTYAEPGQGAPAATTSLAAKINYLFKAWRNKATQTATTYSLMADDGTTVDQKATVSDDATTYTRGEIASGP